MNSIVNLQDAIISLQVQLSTLQQNMVHTGDYKMSAKTYDFSGWLVCDGRTLAQDTYTELYECIGTSFGSTGSNMFNLPDCRGKVFGAIDMIHHMGLDIGAEQHTLTVSELPSHVHTGIVNDSGLHNHDATSGITGGHTHSIANAGSHSHTTNATGGTYGLATADGNNTVIDVDSSSNELNVWSAPIALSVNSDGIHTHTMTASGDHTHSVTVASDGTHSHTFTTNATGSNTAFNIMQPTLYTGNVFIYSR